MLINSEDELVDTHSVYHSSHSIEESDKLPVVSPVSLQTSERSVSRKGSKRHSSKLFGGMDEQQCKKNVTLILLHRHALAQDRAPRRLRQNQDGIPRRHLLIICSLLFSSLCHKVIQDPIQDVGNNQQNQNSRNEQAISLLGSQTMFCKCNTDLPHHR